jgi:V/A-type H+-transporting ATPase subunit E
MERRGSGDERLAAICQKIRNETLEPAKQEAEQIRLNAELEASKIITEAKQQADRLLHDTRKQLQEEQEVFDASLQQAGVHAVDLLKEKIENIFFYPALEKLLKEQFADDERTANVLDALVAFIKKHGPEGNLEVWLGSKLSREKILQHLTKEAIASIPKEGIQVSERSYGFTLSVSDKHLAIEISPDSVREVIASFLRGDYRKFLFRE